MRQLAVFFRTFINSLISPKYYSDILKAKFSFSLKYFFLLSLIISAAMTARIIFPLSQVDVRAFADRAVADYPSNLIVKVKDGKLAINQPLPYKINMPTEVDQHSARPMNLVIFDSDKNVQDANSFYDYNTVALVTETNIYMDRGSDNQEVGAYPIPKDMNVELSPTVVTTLKNNFLNHPIIAKKLYVPLIGAMLFLVLMPVLFIFELLTLFFYSIVLYFIAAIFKAGVLHNRVFSLMKAWQVSLHAATLPLVISNIGVILYGSSPIKGWLYFLIYLVFSLFMLALGTEPGSSLGVVADPSSKKANRTKKTK